MWNPQKYIKFSKFCPGHDGCTIHTSSFCLPITQDTLNIILSHLIWFHMILKYWSEGILKLLRWLKLAGMLRFSHNKYHSLDSFNNINSLFYNSGGYKSTFKVSAGLVPPDGCEEGSRSRPLSLTWRWWLSPNISLYHQCMHISVSKFPLFMKIAIILD